MKNLSCFTLALLFLICGTLQAQLPGGVGNPDLWFQTVGTGGLLTGNYHWQDFSGDSLRLNVYDSRGAAFGEEYSSSVVRFYNGHPALELDKLLDLKSREVQLKRTSLSQATIIGAFAPAAGFDANQLLYSLNGRPEQGVFVGTDKVYPSRESGKEVFDYGETEGMDLRYSSNDVEPNVDAFRESSLRILSYYRTIPPTTNVWGESSKAVLTFNSAAVSGNVNHNSTYSVPLLENRQFVGYIPEIIVYSRLLTPLERQKVDSYMAIKYGISLPVSYLGSAGQLYWDCESNTAYNYRITALYRDDTSGIIQRESATSYEEKPHYTDQLTHDYFYLASPNNRTSESRLLVMGREDGNSIADGHFMFWGDNNATSFLNSTIWQEGLKRMERQWLVKTNIVSNPQTISWNVENLEFNTTGYATDVTKTGGNAATVGTAVTSIPLLEKSGYLAVNHYVITGGLTLRFGSQTPAYAAGSHDYGYYINTDFRAYKIIGGVKESSNFALLALASSIEVEKTETSLFLRVNGIRLPESEIIIATADRNKSFYGAIAVERGLTDAGFTLRYGGFSDTGNRIELSYACAAGFASSDEEKAVLVIDRSGTGEFNSSDLEYIPVSEVDVLRRKLVFHNVFFDRDGNGMDVFTFAYGKTESLGNLEVIPPTCGLVDGEFTLQLDWGVRGYNYVLKNLATGNTVSQGWEGSRNIHVTGLNTGNYELTVSEDGGYTFESDMASGALLRAKTTNFLPAIDGNIPFRVSNITETYTIGYTASTAEVGSASNIFHYGLKQSGNRLYKVENGKETLLSGVTLQTGDELKIEKGLISISYYRNGTKVGSSTIRLQDYGLSFYGLIDFGNGPAELLNVKAEGFFNLIDYRWNVTSGVTAVRAGNSSKKYAIEIPGCETKSTALPLPYAGDNMLQVSVIQGTRMLHVNLTLDVPSRVSLLVFDTKGLPVARQELAEPQTVQTATLQLPQAGVFIVKALTSDGREYGQKVRVN